MDDLDTWKLPWWTQLTWIVFLLNTSNGIAVTPICSQGQTGRCFQVDNTRRSWAQADIECMSKGGSLAKVGSSSDQDTIANFARNNNVPTLWTGGMVTDSDWIWTGLRDRHIQYMGCYGEDTNNPDLEYVINDGRTFQYPSQCSKACSDVNGKYYKFSGVQFDNVYNRIICRCGSSYGKHGKRKDPKCDKQCVPQPPKNTFDERDRETLDRFCGNLGFQIVVRNSGLAFHSWVGPGAQGTHDCAALDQHGFRWKDYHCNDIRLRYICEYDKDQSSCSKKWISTASGGRGICISKHTNNKNWYDAKLDCKNQGGDLLEIRDHVVRDKIKNEVSGSNDKYWIGLTKRTWTWKDGSIIDKYYSWENSKPRATGNTMPVCLLMGPSSYKWTDADCSHQHPFVCEYMNGPPSVGSGNPPPPNQPPNQTPSPTQSPPPNGQAPDNSNRNKAQIDPAIIGGAAGGGALVLIIIVVVVVCCCCKKKPPPKKTKSKGHHSKPPREHRTPKGNNRPPPKVSSRPLPTAPRKSQGGHDNYALSTEHTKPLGGAAKANTYVEGRRPPPTQEEYLTLENPAPQKPSVYEALDKGPDVYEDIIYDKPVEVYEDYLDMTQGMTKPDYDNIKRSAQKDGSYEHYLKPTR